MATFLVGKKPPLQAGGEEAGGEPDPDPLHPSPSQAGGPTLDVALAGGGVGEALLLGGPGVPS